MTEIEAQVRTELSDVYYPGGVEQWLLNRRIGKRWQGRNAYEMIQEGHGDVVLERARKLARTEF